MDWRIVKILGLPNDEDIIFRTIKFLEALPDIFNEIKVLQNVGINFRSGVGSSLGSYFSNGLIVIHKSEKYGYWKIRNERKRGAWLQDHVLFHELGECFYDKMMSVSLKKKIKDIHQKQKRFNYKGAKFSSVEYFCDAFSRYVLSPKTIDKDIYILIKEEIFENQEFDGTFRLEYRNNNIKPYNDIDRQKIEIARIRWGIL